MKTEGEFLFHSFEEALAFVSEPTNYEKERKITITRTQNKFNHPNFKVVLMDKSDGSQSLFLFFKNSTRYDIWKFWCPDEQQLYCLASLPQIINVLEIKNALKPRKLETKRYGSFEVDSEILEGPREPARIEDYVGV